MTQLLKVNKIESKLYDFSPEVTLCNRKEFDSFTCWPPKGGNILLALLTVGCLWTSKPLTSVAWHLPYGVAVQASLQSNWTWAVGNWVVTAPPPCSEQHNKRPSLASVQGEVVGGGEGYPSHSRPPVDHRVQINGRAETGFRVQCRLDRFTSACSRCLRGASSCCSGLSRHRPTSSISIALATSRLTISIIFIAISGRGSVSPIRMMPHSKVRDGKRN